MLSDELTREFGIGFTARALRYYHQFYLAFPSAEIWNTRVPFLTWSHYHPTIGIILCSDTNADVAQFSTLATNNQMFASKYKLYLPTKNELRKEIERQKEIFRLQQTMGK